jgi:two-component system cell cycle response regulator DivK
VIKILYIEDNPLNMRLMRKLLTNAGYVLLEAFDGLSGVALAAREKPDLILMDIQIPDINGVESTCRLKALPELSLVPVIAVTADSMCGNRERLMGLGCDGYLTKPIARHELLQTLSQFLGHKP